MEKSVLKEFTSLVDEQIKELTENIEFLKDQSKPVPPSVALGRLTRMEAINDKSVAEEMLRKSTRRLERMENARKRLDSGTYGLCIRCKKEIPHGRLRAVPEALICIPCSEKKT